MEILTILDAIGVVAFAISGAYTAMQVKMDLLGVYLLATITAVGGGVLRDTIMDRGIPAFFYNYPTIFLVFLSASFVILIRKKFRWHFLITLADTLGLAVFTVASGMTALQQQYNFPAFLFVCVATGVGGGVIRDMLCRRIPVIFTQDIYAMASVAGAVCFWFLYQWLIPVAAIYISLAVVILVRLLSIYFHWSLPKFELYG